MSTVLLLSSSPPRTFARSPTPADSSPCLPSPSELFKGGSPSPKRFKSNAATRDRFPGGFSSAPCPLAVKHGAENLRLGSPCRERFKSQGISSQSTKPKFSVPAKNRKTALDETDSKASAQSKTEPRSNTINADNLGAAYHQTLDAAIELSESVQHLKAVPRRTDWTPLKEDGGRTIIEAVRSQDVHTSFPNGIMASFGLGHMPAPENKGYNHVDDVPKTVKRRKVELLEARLPLQIPLQEASTNLEKQTGFAAKKRTKSPAKKAMTITQLATSHYFGREDTGKDSPAMRYFSSTQARDLDVADVDNIEVLQKAVKQKAKKSTSQKISSSKSKLLSPKSAMQNLETQKTVFGSASQLVGEECAPTNIVSSSDPISPERTQPISIVYTTPQTDCGIRRFVQTRNLWAAAGRDEDNALLHVETVNLCDTPCMKDVFAGKDALVAPAQINGTSHQELPRNTAAPYRTSESPLSVVRRTNVLDVDDFQFPFAKQGVRTLHTGADSISSKSTIVAPEPDQNLHKDRQRVSAAEPSRKLNVPQKPSYGGIETSVLQKQLKTYGFKPVKKREKMIELLEMCWDAKYGKQEHTAEIEEDPRKHGDFLSKVHDISSRPEPKVKKPKKRTKAQIDGASAMKEPKRRQKADTTKQDIRGKVSVKKPRMSRSKKAVASESINNDCNEDSLGTLPPQATAATDEETPSRARTLPPTTSSDILAWRDVRAAGDPGQRATMGDLGEQIQAAILRQSEDAADGNRNHVREPTWHDKILMYDPIILEDLTAWLNTEGLNEINEDHEVSAFDVRAWCESKGICCLWKGGWRGQRPTATED